VVNKKVTDPRDPHRKQQTKKFSGWFGVVIDITYAVWQP